MASKVPAQFFLRLDPLVGLSAAVSARTLAVVTLPAILLLLFTLVLGRFFCGWICPLGSTIDGFDGAAGNHKKKMKHLPLKGVKLFILIAVFVGAVGSVQLAGWVDPISLYTRTVNAVIYPVFVLFMDGLMGIFLSVGFLERGGYVVYDFLRGFVLPIQTVTFQGSVILGLFFLAILALGFIQSRFWCQNICPLGAFLSLFSRWRLYRRKVSDACTSCGLCRQYCRMDAIGEDYKITDHGECISCMDCQVICPVQAISFGFQKKIQPSPVDFNRRRLLTGGVAGLLSIGLIKTGYTQVTRKGYAVRPPGAIEEGEFLDRCVRCGKCIRVCSSVGAGLQHAMLETGWEGFLSPVLIPTTGYCEYTCNLCGQVCPTGAIRPLPLKERQERKIGTAHFDKTRCIPWYYGEDCMVCEEHCPLPEKAIQFRESEVVTIDGRNATVFLPFVKENICIGCGICVNRCPLEGHRGIYLTHADEMRY